jgi:hypothetical protein
MVVVAWKPTTALSRAGVAPNTVKELPGAPAKAAVIGAAQRQVARPGAAHDFFRWALTGGRNQSTELDQAVNS